jgi:chromosome segregation ATPase
MRHLALQSHITDTSVSMPPKLSGEVRKANLAKAREISTATSAQSDQANVLAVSEKNLASARAQVTSLEVAVENLKDNCARLSRDLDAANSKISELNLALQAEHERSESRYKKLRVERRARQRADKRKKVLSKTIAGLRETTETQLQNQKKLEKSAVITENEKQQIELSNIKLRAELLSNVQIFAKELTFSRQLLSSSKAALKGSKSQIYNLKRKCSRAVKKQENAVKRAQTKVAKEKTSFHLLNKGVYSQEVRNLVRTLTQAGCSQQHIMDIIKAVLETAGITAVGKISTRTVGRIIREGYYAACLQLGYEINQADSKK